MPVSDREDNHVRKDSRREEPTRRAVLKGSAVAGLALPVLAACGGGSSDNAGQSSSGPSSSDGNAAGGSSGAGGALTSTANVPVGGGTVIPADQIVVTQPAKGRFEAFSAICTHAGCVVSRVQDGVIMCPCHGSTFSISDGSVLGGPAQSPLPAVTITVEGSTITRA
jgi:Rieske Fe-S protein